MLLFSYSQASPELKNMIENNIILSSKDIQKYCNFLLPKSRKPRSHSKQANKKEEKQIIDWYEKTKVGVKRLLNNLKAKKEIGSLTLGKVKGVYKRNGLKIQKVRTKNQETRSLYNYEQIGAFDHGHYDTKVLADSCSLPKDIYDNLNYNTNLPLYEWNIIFVGCRIRFTAYSRGKSSTFGLQFLVLVLSHLRSNGVISQKLKIDRKTFIDLVTKYSHLKVYAQNVLTYYRLFYLFFFDNIEKKFKIINIF